MTDERQKKVVTPRDRVFYTRMEAWRNYKIDVSDEEMAVLVGMIKKNSPRAEIRRQTSRMSIARLPFRGTYIRVAYDRVAGVIVKVLPGEGPA